MIIIVSTLKEDLLFCLAYYLLSLVSKAEKLKDPQSHRVRWRAGSATGRMYVTSDATRLNPKAILEMDTEWQISPRVAVRGIWSSFIPPVTLSAFHSL